MLKQKWEREREKRGMEEDIGWMKDGEKNSSLRTEDKRGRGGWGGLTLERRLWFLSSSPRRPVSDAAVWHKSQHLPFCLRMRGRRELL